MQHDANGDRCGQLQASAESMLQEACPPLSASLYMRYQRDGNRSAFETAYFRRRTRLTTFVIGECMEHKGRFVDAVIDALWAIMEETTWCVPAHAEYGDNDPLPLADRWTVDLFASETAATLAEALFLLHDELQAVSPSLLGRISDAIRERVLDPVLNREDIGWFSGRNNWAPWCASNTLAAAMYTIDDRNYLARLTHRLMAVADRFIAGYPPDGGCDEGPHYWNVATGALAVFLELLHSRSAGRIDIYDEPKLRAMGHYIVTVHLDGPWFAMFADTTTRVPLRRGMTYRLGERTHDPELMNLALLAAYDWDPAHTRPSGFASQSGPLKLGTVLQELFWLPPEQRPERPRYPLSSWLPDSQVLVARQSAEPANGFVLAAKGGHNAESHNHNDIGQFIILLNGSPCVVDNGRPPYTRKTFGPRRYEIWCIRSTGHDVPIVNGIEQAPGEHFRATEVQFDDTAERAVLRMHLEQAYAQEAGLAALIRELELDRTGDGAITLRDSYAMARGEATMAVSLYTPETPVCEQRGVVRLNAVRGSLLVQYDPDVLKSRTEPVGPEDRDRLSWGDSLHRVRFTTVASLHTGAYELRFVPQGTE
ncbi:MAG: hypothetical protein GF331_23315 [Chitinivibrionales bacterium]|nr:hypothetical protein [Chitinivibrionales bacterium]